MKKTLIVAVLALTAFAHADDAKKPTDPVHPFESYEPAMASTTNQPLAAEWQKDHVAEIAAATKDCVLAGFVADAASARVLLAKLRGPYDNDPIVLTQVGAVSQWVMGRGRCAARKIWVEALLDKAETTVEPYIALLCLDQLRWCGPSCPKVAARVRGIGEMSRCKAVRELACITARTLSKK